MPMPIRLPYGDPSFGAQHIMLRHGKWVMDNEPTGCVATLVWQKLSQRGAMYVEQQTKLNLSLKINPSALLILKQLDGFYPLQRSTTISVRLKGKCSERTKAFIGRRRSF